MKRQIVKPGTDAKRANPVTIIRDRPPGGLLGRVSYAVGLHIARHLRGLPFDFMEEALLAGLRDGITKTEPLLTDLERRDLFLRFQHDLMTKGRARRRIAAKRNLSEGAAFLAENQLKEGIHTLPSGLQYRVLTEGVGPVPSATDVVYVNYRGVFLDGMEFDNSAHHAEPVRFRINQTIPGLAEALCRMKLGAKWMLFVPASLAYGERGAGRLIPPNATLIYELELVWIEC